LENGATFALLDRLSGMDEKVTCNPSWEPLMSEKSNHPERTEEQDGKLLEKLLNDRVLSRYMAQVGYSTLSKVQECLRYQNQIFRHMGDESILPDLMAARAKLVPAYAVRTRRGFQA
jgi:hypothetical protein